MDWDLNLQHNLKEDSNEGTLGIPSPGKQMVVMQSVLKEKRWSKQPGSGESTEYMRAGRWEWRWMGFRDRRAASVGGGLRRGKWVLWKWTKVSESWQCNELTKCVWCMWGKTHPDCLHADAEVFPNQTPYITMVNVNLIANINGCFSRSYISTDGASRFHCLDMSSFTSCAYYDWAEVA